MKVWRTFAVTSEKPYTKSENVISKFSWHRIEERTKSILKKKIASRAQFYTEVWPLYRSKLQKANFEKKVFKVFLSWRVVK